MIWLVLREATYKFTAGIGSIHTNNAHRMMLQPKHTTAIHNVIHV